MSPRCRWRTRCRAMACCRLWFRCVGEWAILSSDCKFYSCSLAKKRKFRLQLFLEFGIEVGRSEANSKSSNLVVCSRSSRHGASGISVFAYWISHMCQISWALCHRIWKRVLNLAFALSATSPKALLVCKHNHVSVLRHWFRALSKLSPRHMQELQSHHSAP